MRKYALTTLKYLAPTMLKALKSAAVKEICLDSLRIDSRIVTSLNTYFNKLKPIYSPFYDIDSSYFDLLSDKPTHGGWTASTGLFYIPECSVWVWVNNHKELTTVDHKSKVHQQFSMRCLATDFKKLHTWLNGYIQNLSQGVSPSINLLYYQNEAPVYISDISIPDLNLNFVSQGIKDLVDDLEEFIQSEQWYAERQLKYKRVYLLHGPPGTGKTTLVQQLAKRYGKDINVLPYGRISGLDFIGGTWLRNQSFVLVEDIHALYQNLQRKSKSRDDMPVSVPKVFDRPEECEDEVYYMPNISSLLNILDGTLTQHGQIIFITTNHYDILPTALTRKGRIDITVEIGWTSPEHIQGIINNFYKSPINPEIPEPMTVAEVHSMLLQNKNKPENIQQAIYDLIATKNEDANQG